MIIATLSNPMGAYDHISKLGIGPLAVSQALALGVYDVKGGVNKSLRARSGFISPGYPKAYYLPM